VSKSGKSTSDRTPLAPPVPASQNCVWLATLLQQSRNQPVLALKGVTADGCKLHAVPGLYTEEQIEGWKPITAAVRENVGTSAATAGGGMPVHACSLQALGAHNSNEWMVGVHHAFGLWPVHTAAR
jgi:hypothetical protein